MRTHTHTLLRALECLLLFVVLPMVFVLELVPVPKMLALPAFTLVCVLLYRRMMKGHASTGLWSWRPLRAYAPRLALRTLAVAVFAIGWIVWRSPDDLLAFPLQRPGIWVMVMLLYPWLSALPQEFLYRTFFFARYRSLFGRGASMIAASAIAFALLHAIYDHPLSVALSFIGGWWFGRTYHDTRSLAVVALEHAVYGALFFTFGMGRYFYEGR